MLFDSVCLFHRSQVRLFRPALSRGPVRTLQKLHDVQALSIEPVAFDNAAYFDDDYQQDVGKSGPYTEEERF